MLTFPPALILIPVLIPIVILAAEIFEWKNSKKIESEYGFLAVTDAVLICLERETEARDSREAIEQLEKICKAMASFQNDITVFCEFWTKQDVQLEDLKDRLHALRRGGKADRLHVQTILTSSSEAKEDYRAYVTIVRAFLTMLVCF